VDILTPTGLIAANMVIPARDVDAIFLRAVGERVEAAIGDTAVVTETVWVKGSINGRPVDQKLSVTETYVRTPNGWRYVSGQASLPVQ